MNTYNIFLQESFTSRLLVVRPVEAHISRISNTSVQAIWSNLMMEMLYLTNDDEERYSIQAQQSILRNMCVQIADPPLGYAIYSSKPMYNSTLPTTVVQP